MPACVPGRARARRPVLAGSFLPHFAVRRCRRAPSWPKGSVAARAGPLAPRPLAARAAAEASLSPSFTPLRFSLAIISHTVLSNRAHIRSSQVDVAAFPAAKHVEEVSVILERIVQPVHRAHIFVVLPRLRVVANSLCWMRVGGISGAPQVSEL